jgi:ribosome biogenesis GTPase A
VSWAKWFTSQGIRFIFFSAKREQMRLEEQDRRNQLAADLALEMGGVEALQGPGAAAGNVDLSAGGPSPLDQLAAASAAAATAGEDSATATAPADGAVEGSVACSARSGISRFSSLQSISLRAQAARATARGLHMTDALRKALMVDSDDEGSDSDSERAADERAAKDEAEAEAEEKARTVRIEEPAKAETTEPAEPAVDPLAMDQTPEARDRQQEDHELSVFLAPTDPLFPSCRILSRDELLALLDKYATEMPRGVLGGPAEAVAKRKLVEMKQKRREGRRAARAEELRRRAIMAQRLVEAGLGAQVRFGTAGDVLGETAEQEGKRPRRVRIEGAEGAGDNDDEDDDEEEDEEASDSEDEDVRPPLVFGMVGYPNVGKSSTINALLGATATAHGTKRVAVASTPGKTKHFQTLKLSEDIMLCDCPGLVFPSFINSKEEMVVNGVLPIDQLRDHTSPVRLLCQRIPRRDMEANYGLALPAPGPGEHRDRQPTPFELMDTYCRARGLSASTHGGWDHPRGARSLLKDYCNGLLLFCHAPPGGWAAWCGYDPTVARDEGDSSAAAISARMKAAAASAAKGNRISFADNVLLSTEQERFTVKKGTLAQSKLEDDDRRANAVSSAPLPGSAAAASAAAEDDEQSSDGSSVSSLPSDIDEETLRGFVRIIKPAKQKAVYVDEEGAEYELDSDEERELIAAQREGRPPRFVVESDDEDEDEGDDGAVAIEAGIHGAGSSGKTSKKQMKKRRMRKGEKKWAQQQDPYNTAAAADAANRKYQNAEIASVSAGPAGHAAVRANGLMVDPFMPSDMKTGASSSTTAVPRPANGTVGVTAGATNGASKQESSYGKGAAGFKDAVPAHLRGLAAAPPGKARK